MIKRYIDAHCHVQFKDYDNDREMVVEQMRTQEVGGIVVGCDLASSRAAVELAQKHEHLYAAIGLHPDESDEHFDVSAYRALAASKRVVAIGECGLDYYRATQANTEGSTSVFVKQAKGASSAYYRATQANTEGSTSVFVKQQKELFKAQIALAAELDLPLIIHARPSKGTMDAYHDVASLLREAKVVHPNLRGDMHFFVGGVAEAQIFIALGFTVSFTAVITFARDYDAVIRAVPLTSLLAETDAPYVAPAGRRGQRNDPLAVIEVAAKIALIRGEEVEVVRAALWENTRRLFKLEI